MRQLQNMNDPEVPRILHQGEMRADQKASNFYIKLIPTFPRRPLLPSAHMKLSEHVRQEYGRCGQTTVRKVLSVFM